MKRKPNGFTLIELLIVIVIIAILAAILFPIFAATKRLANKSQCISNIRQMAMATLQYTDDYNGYLPPYRSPFQQYLYWPVGIIKPYIKNDNIFKCRLDTGRFSDYDWYGTSYYYNVSIYGYWQDDGTLLDPDSVPPRVGSVKNIYTCKKPESLELWFCANGRKHYTGETKTFSVSFGDGHAALLTHAEDTEYCYLTRKLW